MSARSLAFNAARLVAVALALAILLLTPAIRGGTNGISFEPVGLALDLAAVVMLLAVVWSVLAARSRNA